MIAAACCIPSFAEQTDIGQLMKRDDYIVASLIVVSPGERVYSAGGHIALRMRCPVHSVDYVYEFDATLQGNESMVAEYLNNSLNGEYIRLYADDFFNNVKTEKRTFSEYILNLSPAQEVALWAQADECVDEPDRQYPFTPTGCNCCSMLVRLVEASSGINIGGDPSLRAALKGSGRRYLTDFFESSPWTGLLWNILLGTDFDRPRQPVNLLYPKIIADKLSLVGGAEAGKPLISAVGEANAFRPADDKLSGPLVLFLMLFVATCAVTGCNIFHRLTVAGRWLDCALVVAVTSVGCVLWYMTLTSFSGHSPAIYTNLLAILFNPAALILVFARRLPVRGAYAACMALVAAAFLVCYRFIPQLHHYGLWLFVSAVLVRSAYNAYCCFLHIRV